MNRPELYQPEDAQPNGLITDNFHKVIKSFLRPFIPGFRLTSEDPREYFAYQYEASGLASTDHISALYRSGMVYSSFSLYIEYFDDVLNHGIKQMRSDRVQFVYAPELEVISSKGYESWREDNDLNIWEVYLNLRRATKIFDAKTFSYTQARQNLP